MEDFRKRRGIRSELLRAALSTVGLVVVGLMAYFAARGAWGMYQKFAEASAASAAAETNLAALQTRNTEVQAEVDALRTDRGTEEVFRQRYGVAKQGEGEITVVHPVATSTASGTGEGGWLGKLWHALFVW